MPHRPIETGPRRWREHTVTEADAGMTLQEVLTGPLAVSRRMIQRLTRSRGILLNRRPGFLGRKVRTGDVVAVRVAEDEEAALEPVPMDLDIVHEDRDLLVVNKPPFLLVHPVSPAHTRTLAHGIAHHYREQGLEAKVRPVHRLDRDTSGLLLVAKTAYAHQRLDRQLRERTMRRVYEALVRGVVAVPDGVIDAPIGRHRSDPRLRAVRLEAGEPAVTRYRVLERYPAASLLGLELETGRTHQIRVHLAHLGHPVVGDSEYGGGSERGLRRQALHASRLSFTHPGTGEVVAYEAPPPADFREATARLRG